MSTTETCTRKHPVTERCKDPECYRLPPVVDAFGPRLRHYREALGISKTELARRVRRMLAVDRGVMQHHIADYEASRRTPSLDRARALADVLGVSLDRLVGRDAYGPIRFPRVEFP